MKPMFVVGVAVFVLVAFRRQRPWKSPGLCCCSGTLVIAAGREEGRGAAGGTACLASGELRTLAQAQAAAGRWVSWPSPMARSGSSRSVRPVDRQRAARRYWRWDDHPVAAPSICSGSTKPAASGQHHASAQPSGLRGRLRAGRRANLPTPHGVMRIGAGKAEAGHGADTPMQVSSSGSVDLKALVMLVLDATKPFSSPATLP